MEGLKKILHKKPHIQTVWMNDKGEWLFSKHPNFPDEVSREEILGQAKKEVNEPVVEEENTEPPKEAQTKQTRKSSKK